MSWTWTRGTRKGSARRMVRADGASLVALIMREHMAIEQASHTSLFTAVTPASTPSWPRLEVPR